MRKKKPTCAVCGEKLEPETAIGHILLAHGPVKDKRRRRRVRGRLPQIHRRLEEKGFSESDAHIIVQVVGEEFRKAGMV